MDGFETKCQAKKDDVCVFLIGKKDDPEIIAKMNEYLTPPKIQTRIDDRLDVCLRSNPLRSIGNLVNIWYYRLLITNSIMTDLMPATLSFDLGVKYGSHLASVISVFYQDYQLSVIKKYYCQLHQLDVIASEVGDGIDIVLTECAEAETARKKQELLDFICGELQGLVSSLIGRQMVYKESCIDGNNLKIKLLPQTQSS